MATFRRNLFLLLGSLVVCSLALVFAALKSYNQHDIQILLVAVFLLLSVFIAFVLYNFKRLRAVEAGRRELEDRLGFLVQHIKDYAIFLIDPEGRVMSWNQGAQQIKGYTADEVLGKPISIFYTEEESRRGEPFQNLRHAVEEGRYESIGLRKRKDGSLFYADVVFTPMHDEKGHLKGFIKITRDITKQKKAEEDIHNSLKREKELNEMKSRFVTLASHEFKTPLSVILSSASLIGKYTDAETQDKRLKHIHRIKSNVNNLKQILNDFLSLEKLEGGIARNLPVSTDLQDLVHDIIQDIKETLKEGQSIDLSIEGHPRTINVDAHLLRNVLMNLLSNASKYSPENTVIDCRLVFLTAAVSICIHDRGIGIPADEQEHLFERFFRASNVTAEPGTGLGLNIVRKYLDLMGGNISMESLPDEGSTFIVTIPDADILINTPS